MTAPVLLDMIERVRHPRQDGWLFLRELRVGTGRQTSQAQRLDAFALCRWPLTAMKRVCRADFLCELKHPLKRRMGMRYSNEFYFVTPPGLLEEIPHECGWLEVDRASPISARIRFPRRGAIRRGRLGNWSPRRCGTNGENWKSARLIRPGKSGWRGSETARNQGPLLGSFRVFASARWPRRLLILLLCSFPKH